MNTKKCSKCKQILSNKDFYKGQKECKSCKRISARKWARTERGKKKKAEYKQSERGKEVARKWREKNKQKVKAHKMVNSAVRKGEIPHISTQLCISCSNKAMAYHHYKGYENENIFEIIPVCGVCHAKLEN